MIISIVIIIILWDTAPNQEQAVDSDMLSTRVANHSTGVCLSCPLSKQAI